MPNSPIEDRKDSELISAPVSAPGLACYRIRPDAPEIAPAHADRDWMDQTNQRYAYRCIPLSIANASGWEILLPRAIEATYFGGHAIEDLKVRCPDGSDPSSLATSHFGHGILTFHTGWLFRTPPGWALWVRGSPNTHRNRIAPLEGLVETDWLSMSFTMNWRFTRPGTVRFEAGEPFCFITLVAHAALDDVQPRIFDLSEAPALKAEHEAWSESRIKFNADLKSLESEAVAQGWQKTYIRGQTILGGAPPEFHISKRRLRSPK
ncbi:MAG TPA: DUF6065 family protein [Methylovirgula sp.]|nr:DUF6065 family protein [Methylovirgula sp.]